MSSSVGWVCLGYQIMLVHNGAVLTLCSKGCPHHLQQAIAECQHDGAWTPFPSLLQEGMLLVEDGWAPTASKKKSTGDVKSMLTDCMA